jgi:hypothetical protein
MYIYTYIHTYIHILLKIHIYIYMYIYTYKYISEFTSVEASPMHFKNMTLAYLSLNSTYLGNTNLQGPHPEYSFIYIKIKVHT